MTRERTKMKRVFWFVMLGAVAVAMTGCNQSWPSCFCNGGGKVYYDQCDPCSTSYSPEVVEGPWITSPTVETLPGPATVAPNAG
jgi:hypothetical protein